MGWKGRDSGRGPEEDTRREWKRLAFIECERIRGALADVAKHQTEDVAQCGLGQVVYSPDMDQLLCEREKLESQSDEGMNHQSANSRISPSRKSFAIEARPDWEIVECLTRLILCLSAGIVKVLSRQAAKWSWVATGSNKDMIIESQDRSLKAFGESAVRILFRLVS